MGMRDEDGDGGMKKRHCFIWGRKETGVERCGGGRCTFLRIMHYFLCK